MYSDENQRTNIMKRTILFITSLVLIVGCSKEPINYETLIDKDGLKYHPDTKELYSGKVFTNYIGGKTNLEGSYKDGKENGLWTEWYENGQKKKKETYKDGEEVGKWTYWYENGQKMKGETYRYRDGEEVGKWTQWYENGQKMYEVNYKDGWKDGLYTSWYKNGQKLKEETYKDGKLISHKEWNEDGSVK